MASRGESSPFGSPGREPGDADRGIANSAPALRSLVRKALALVLFALAAATSGADLPKIPPLPATSWPSAADAEPFARELMAKVTPSDLARTLDDKPDLVPAILRNLGTAVMTNDRVATYLAEVARASTKPDAQLLTSLMVIDPLRYGEEAAFRRRIDALLPATIALLPRDAAREVIHTLTTSAGLDFDTGEAASFAAHLIPRVSAERHVAYDGAALDIPDDLAGPIEASFFSLSSAYFTRDAALRFLTAVHDASPQRRIVVLADAPMRAALANDAARLRLTLVGDQSRPFTPWPRDPFIVARSAKSVVFVNRPNLQPHREEDQQMVRAIIDALPAATDASWNARWTVAPAPFHNGQILRAPGTAWISIHTLEPRILAMLGLDHVPTETFDTPAGVKRYTEAARRAATELEGLYHCRVRFVHALSGSPDLMTRLGGGAGFDLDSILTILPRANGKTDALVGSVALGVELAKRAPASDWTAARKAFGFGDPAALIVAQNAPATVALQAFLDEIAAELQRDGMNVRRLPLLNVPNAEGTPYLLTWNNVVLEKRGALLRAEGFASLLPSMDAYAKEAFAKSGYRLDLFPPLIRSIVLGGGYRCASNHLRPHK